MSTPYQDLEFYREHGYWPGGEEGKKWQSIPLWAGEVEENCFPAAAPWVGHAYRDEIRRLTEERNQWRELALRFAPLDTLPKCNRGE